MTPPALRPYDPSDAPALLALFRRTVHAVNARDYTPEQLRAWAPDDLDPIAWSDRFAGKWVVVAEIDGVPAGFADLEPDGHIDRFFVAADRQRRGVGAALLSAIVAEARRVGHPRLTVEASLTARPFFAAHGFIELARQEVKVRGVALTNFRMERLLGPTS